MYACVLVMVTYSAQFQSSEQEALAETYVADSLHSALDIKPRATAAEAHRSARCFSCHARLVPALKLENSIPPLKMQFVENSGRQPGQSDAEELVQLFNLKCLVGQLDGIITKKYVHGRVRFAHGKYGDAHAGRAVSFSMGGRHRFGASCPFAAARPLRGVAKTYCERRDVARVGLD